MNKRVNLLILAAFFIIAAMIGPIEQYAHYHDFADQKTWLSVPYGKDVWSNLGFLWIGFWGMWQLKRHRINVLSAYVSMAAMMLTAFGSAYYHVNPNDWTLIWDRLPISLVCAGLISSTITHLKPTTKTMWLDTALIAVAILGVAVWHVNGDLRWYLGLQLWCVLVLPYWLMASGTAKPIQWAMLAAIFWYVLAKITESTDVWIWQHTQQLISGHTLKHLLASVALYEMAKAIVLMHLPNQLNANADRLTNQQSDWLVCSDQCDRR